MKQWYELYVLLYSFNTRCTSVATDRLEPWHGTAIYVITLGILNVLIDDNDIHIKRLCRFYDKAKLSVVDKFHLFYHFVFRPIGKTFTMRVLAKQNKIKQNKTKQKSINTNLKEHCEWDMVSAFLTPHWKYVPLESIKYDSYHCVVKSSTTSITQGYFHIGGHLNVQ